MAVPILFFHMHRTMKLHQFCLTFAVANIRRPVPAILFSTSSKRSCKSHTPVNPQKIYTKTGDTGTTCLFTGERLPKDSDFFQSLGNIDELSSHIGLCKELALEKNHEYVNQLERIQCVLQDVGSLIATPKPLIDPNNSERAARVQQKLAFDPNYATELEEWIDQFSSKLPPLSNFILPGGGQVGASLHVARSVCRRAERSILPLLSRGLVDEQVFVYVNRLSDYLFTVARFACLLDKQKETIYIRPNVKLGSVKKCP